jgi:hypothetical protein
VDEREREKTDIAWTRLRYSMATTETNLSEMKKKRQNRLEKEEVIYIYESCFMAEKKIGAAISRT